MEGPKPDSAHSDPKLDSTVDRKMTPDLEEGVNHPPPPPPQAEEASSAAVNGSPDSKMKSHKSVRWSEQLVSESSYTPSVDPDTTAFPAGSNPYVAHSSSPSPPPSANLKGPIINSFVDWILLSIEFWNQMKMSFDVDWLHVL